MRKLCVAASFLRNPKCVFWDALQRRCVAASLRRCVAALKISGNEK
jgi:hypothetical protein